ncbi:unnamed protein product [Prorocentrum cordatum]|uniref:Uncharacterized protein n=1 Tax=Prorocentrum cordatum TaxID=2364126 RepID=A0ABN9T512_9DINO|nr:unnamed protein product [Polarella glacialis]
MVAPCIADLVKVNKAINDGRRGADYMQKFPKGIGLSRATSDEIARYKSIGGHFLFIVDHDVLSGKLATAAMMDYSSKSTQRVCRGTLAAEASHLADSLEAGEWLCVLLEEVFNPRIDLKNWQKIVARRIRVFLTDVKSVHDYLTKEGSGLSRDKRMAIEGALLKEALRQPNATLRRVDGLQNLADILTKEGVDLEYFRHYLRTNQITIQQDLAALLNPIDLKLIDYDVSDRPLEFEMKTCRMAEMYLVYLPR